MSDDEFDINKITSDFVENRYKSIIKKLGDFFKKRSKNIQIKDAFKQYLEKVGEDYCKTKSFFFRDERVLVSDFYIPLSVKSRSLKIKSVSLKQLLQEGNNILITGTGGAGKSILIKHLLLNSYTQSEKIPVFFELRHLNDTEIKSLEVIVHNCLNTYNLELTQEYVNESLAKGDYLIFLDGLDEVESALRDKLVKNINLFTKKYSGCEVILTCRPDSRLSELSSFHIFHTLALDLDESIALINKLPAANEIKSKFINDLKIELFNKHRSFLSNPLLLSIMLLTYGHSAEIPNKLSIFYNQAYEALFHRHDTFKGVFKRKREANLDIQDFEKVFSGFSIWSYSDRKFQFSKAEALEYIDKAKQYFDLDFRNISYYEDLLQSVCLLVEDGLFSTFTHRSFQEYFTAKFISRADTAVKKQLLTKFESNIQYDSVFKLLYEIDKEFIESQIWLPWINKYLKDIEYKKSVTPTVFLNHTKLLWSGFSWHLSNELVANVIPKGRDKPLWHIIHTFDRGKELLKKLDQYGARQSDAIFEKYFKDEDDVIRSSDLTIRNPFFKDLYSKGGYLSKGLIECLIEVKKALDLKYDKRVNDLDTILNHG